MVPAGYGQLYIQWLTIDRQNLSGASFNIQSSGYSTIVQSGNDGRVSVLVPTGTYTISIIHSGNYANDEPQTVVVESAQTYFIYFYGQEEEPLGEEGQVWTAGSDGKGRWEESTSKMRVIATKDSGTIIPKNPSTGTSGANSYRINRNGMQYISDGENYIIFYHAHDRGSSVDVTSWFYDALSEEEKENLAKEIFNVSDLSILPEGTYTLTIGFGPGSGLRFFGDTSTMTLTVLSTGEVTISMYNNRTAGNSEIIYWVVESFSMSS